MTLACVSLCVISAQRVLARNTDDQRVAVTELTNNAGVPQRVSLALTESVRGEVAELLGRHYLVMSKENILSLVEAAVCDEASEASCEVEMGRKLGAHFIISGALTKLGGKLKLSLKVHSTHDARLLGVREDSARDINGVKRLLPRVAHGASALIDKEVVSQGDVLSAELEALQSEAEVRTMLDVLSSGSRCSCAVSAGLGKAGITWVRIPGGSFMMGSNEGGSDEKPVHRVRVPAFLMSKTEVTVRQYRRCVEAGRCTEPGTGHKCNWGESGREDHPINCVNWGQARTFAKWVGADVDLPTEAEWEYAARGGQRFKYAGSDSADEVGWYYSNSGGSTHRVGTKKANGFGLHDMSGNVGEWTLDEYKDSYSGAPSDGSQARGHVPICGTKCDKYSAGRVVRGGSWILSAARLRVASRFNISLGNLRNSLFGFRLRRMLPTKR